MDEKEAWELLATACSNPVNEGLSQYGTYFEGCQRLEINKMLFFGLCGAIQALLDAKNITEDVYESMLGKISKHKPTATGFKWEINSLGMQERVKFCNARVSELCQSQP